MQLTGKQIVAEGIITGYDTENAVQQQGIDVRVIGINYVDGVGRVYAGNTKTKLPEYRSVPVAIKEEGDTPYWYLTPGYYEITLEEGCKIPANRAMTLIQRSSLLRCGAIIRSSQFDGGFETDHMGTFMMVQKPIEIEYMARVAQTIVNETAEVAKEDLYRGQFWKDSQRKDIKKHGRKV